MVDGRREFVSKVLFTAHSASFTGVAKVLLLLLFSLLLLMIHALVCTTVCGRRRCGSDGGLRTRQTVKSDAEIPNERPMPINVNK